MMVLALAAAAAVAFSVLLRADPYSLVVSVQGGLDAPHFELCSRYLGESPTSGVTQGEF